MARIQILELPSIVNGENVTTPIAIVIDQVDADEIRSQAGVVRTNLDSVVDIESVKEQTGAIGVLVTADTLDVT